MTYTFDDEETIAAMAQSASIDLEVGLVTLFGVVCVGTESEPHYSHGGQLTLDGNLAIATAKLQNEKAAQDGEPCRYLPAALGLDPDELVQLALLVTGGAVLTERDPQDPQKGPPDG